MRMLYLKPQVFKFEKFEEFSKEFKIGKGDLIFTRKSIYEPFLKFLNLECDFMFQNEYGNGEPSDVMVDKILADMKGRQYKRIIAVGGGTVIDIAKLLVLKDAEKTSDIFERRIPLVKDRELITIPTTCGSGSEVSNISIVEITEKGTKLGLAIEEIYADYTVLIPELLNNLPYKFFAFSSIDALIHAFESFVSPKSNCYTELFSLSAIRMILNGYSKISENGEKFRLNIMEDFLTASNYAGIAFATTGTGAVHALSYPLSGCYHVPHGEANYQFFIEVFKTYCRLNPDGKIKQLNETLMEVLKIEDPRNIYEALEQVLSNIINKKKLKDFGMKEQEIPIFTDSVIDKQQRLLQNNYVPLSREEIIHIYKNLY